MKLQNLLFDLTLRPNIKNTGNELNDLLITLISKGWPKFGKAIKKTDQDLVVIGFLPNSSQELIKIIYYLSDLDSVKIYLTIDEGKYSICSYRLGLVNSVS